MSSQSLGLSVIYFIFITFGSNIVPSCCVKDFISCLDQFIVIPPELVGVGCGSRSSTSQRACAFKPAVTLLHDNHISTHQVRSNVNGFLSEVIMTSRPAGIHSKGGGICT